MTQKRTILARKFRFEFDHGDFDHDDFDQDVFDHDDFLSGQFRFDPESLTPTVDWGQKIIWNVNNPSYNFFST